MAAHTSEFDPEVQYSEDSSCAACADGESAADVHAVCLADDSFVSDQFLAERYAVHRVTVWRWVRTEQFPPPVRLTSACSRWRMRDVIAWEISRHGGQRDDC